MIRGLDLNFRYPSAWQRNIHRRIATGSQRCGITDQIKNQYFPLKTLRSGPPCRSDITAASFAFNANLTRFRGSSNSDQFFAAAAAIARPIKASHHRCGPFASVVLSLSLSLRQLDPRGQMDLSSESGQTSGKKGEKERKKKIRSTRRWNKHRSTNLKRSRNPDIGISLSVWFILFIVGSLTGIGISLSFSGVCSVKVPFLRPISYFSARFDLSSSEPNRLRLRL